MPILNLGINDVMYTQGKQAPRRVVHRVRRGKVQTFTAAAPGQQTTGDVAEILEEKYGILQAFVDDYGEKIADALAHSVAGAIDNIFMGAPPPANPYAEAESEIEEGMKAWLDLQMMDGRIPGVPTEAARRGVNHRLAHPFAKSNPARPSFIDTGLYQANLRSWISFDE